MLSQKRTIIGDTMQPRIPRTLVVGVCQFVWSELYFKRYFSVNKNQEYNMECALKHIPRNRHLTVMAKEGRTKEG